MAKTIFFTAVEVGGTLDGRKGAYGELTRNSTTIAWLYKKIAYADASAKSNFGAATLGTPTGGGLGTSGLYARDGVGGFIPKPHIKSVAVSHEGNFGSLKKIQIDFTCYSKTQLESMRAFFDLGGDLTVTWGWKDAAGLGGAPGKFIGTIYNFNYSLNGDGGWDCSSYGMSKGINTISGEVTAQASGGDQSTTDALGNKIPMNTIASVLTGLQTEFAAKITPKQLVAGFGVQKMPASYGAAEVPEASSDTQEPAPTAYVTLEALVKFINGKVLAQAGGTALAGCRILCDVVTTRGNCPTGGSTVLVSGDPRKVLFPGYAAYGDAGGDFDFDFTNESENFKAGDLSKICLNIDYISSLLADTGQDKAGSEMAADQSIAGFLNKIFDCININSGKRFQLALVQDPNEGHNPALDKIFLVVDVNYTEGSITPYEFTAVNTNSMVRSMNVVSKIPTAMQTTVFVGGKSALAPGGGPVGVLSGNTAPPKPPPNPLADFESIKKLIGQSTDPAAAPGAKSSTGPTDANVAALQSALTAVAESNQSGKDYSKERIPFPVDLTLTIDGIEGLFFGNAITCNQLPAPLNDVSATKVAFTITKVNHTIADGDWTTTINTVCRMQLA